MTTSYPLALAAAEGPVFVLDQSTLDRGMTASRESPRRRVMLPVQRASTDVVQRLLNFMQRSSYARPHHHPAPGSIEQIVVVKGAAGFLVFDDRGMVRSAHRLEAGNPAACLIDIEQGLWHTVVPLADDTVLVEIKRGPYDAATDKTFAAWAPEEDAPQAADYLSGLEAIFGVGEAK